MARACTRRTPTGGRSASDATYRPRDVRTSRWRRSTAARRRERSSGAASPPNCASGSRCQGRTRRTANATAPSCGWIGQSAWAAGSSAANLIGIERDTLPIPLHVLHARTQHFCRFKTRIYKRGTIHRDRYIYLSTFKIKRFSNYKR